MCFTVVAYAKYLVVTSAFFSFTHIYLNLFILCKMCAFGLAGKEDQGKKLPIYYSAFLIHI